MIPGFQGEDYQIIKVQGHTDDRPPYNQLPGIPQNGCFQGHVLQLRLNFFMKRSALIQKKIETAGNWSYRPVASNDNNEGRSENRPYGNHP
jgi:flagellar motor protein MotB